MTFSGWRHLLVRELQARPGRTVLSATTLFTTSILCGLVLQVAFYLAGELQPSLARMFPGTRIVAGPAEVDISILKISSGGIDPRLATTIARQPGVSRVMPQASLHIPASAHISLGSLDTEFTTDVIVHGAPRELVAGDLGKVAFESGRDTVPVLVSAFFLDMYNMGMAESAGLPRLSRSAALGRTFTMVLGESSVGLTTIQKPREVKCRVVGLCTNPRLAGIVAPLGDVLAWNNEFKPGPGTFTQLHIDLSSPAEVEGVRGALQKMGLRVDSAGEEGSRYRRILSTIEGLLAGASLGMLLLGAVAVGAVTAMGVRERRGVWGLYRATGMSRLQALALALGPTGLLALGAAGAGCVACAGVGRLLAHRFGPMVAELTILPSDPFQLRADTVAGILLGVTLAALLPALAMVLPVLKAEPSTLLAERVV